MEISLEWGATRICSLLGPILFLVYINDLEEGVTGKILKFADDTKLFTKTKEIGDKQNLQDDIDKLVKWSEKWQMLFNFGKCKCLHIGPGNTSMTYEMGGTILSTTVKEKDLGVTMNANMKVSEQCRIAASKAASRKPWPAGQSWPADLIQLARVGMLSAQIFLLMTTK